ncbi:hypothetical protein BOTBODRAFT_31363 [Botryobasidium botryosum FD-172 SS1]|uniref:Uncharacterized protein n=1 Tax=Botryobasidium botryosum (strain FD-172 SS1) TaxID=930990 RepID=A0A067MWK8_BOTB1|nr:hypothetical protein BOTBODRAFT_31363 [Botryobasidium botryosum FD-172 SS1]
MDSKADVEAKLKIAKEKKAAGDEDFRKGDVQPALRSYHESLLYLQGLDKSVLSAVNGQNNPPPASTEGEKAAPIRTEADELIEKIYCNMSACHIKNSNWTRALESANKALAKNENNTKALFRKAKALAGSGYTEKAIEVLEDLLEKTPNDAAVRAELKAVKAVDKERETKAMKTFKGMFNK